MQAYSDPSRANDTWSLPNVEIFEASYRECECGCSVFTEYNSACPECDDDGSDDDPDTSIGWFYWYCFPGCLPDSEPIGPFNSSEAAHADMLEAQE